MESRCLGQVEILENHIFLHKSLNSWMFHRLIVSIFSQFNCTNDTVEFMMWFSDGIYRGNSLLLKTYSHSL